MPQRMSRNPQGRQTPLREQSPELSTPWHGIAPVTGNECQPLSPSAGEARRSRKHLHDLAAGFWPYLHAPTALL